MKKKLNYVLSIDQGSTSTRTVVYDENLRLICSSQMQIKEFYPNNGWVEQDPKDLLRSIRDTMIEAITKNNIDKEYILSIGLTNQRETIVFWDKKTLEPLSPAISWQCLRGIDICNSIVGTKLEAMINESTGLKVDHYFSFSKIAWALRNIKSLLCKKDLCVGTIDSWILANIVDGNPHITEITNASRTGLFNTKTETWDIEILDGLEIPISVSYTHLTLPTSDLV